MRRLVAASLTSLLFIGASACAAAYPVRPDGPILDQAGIISDAAEGALDDRLRQYFDQTCRALVIVTVSSLRGEPVNEFARNLANSWKVGGPVRGDGVLLLVAPSERQVRIEVSRSLEDAMPDAAAAEIINGGMLIDYAAGDYAGGISKGVDGMVSRLDAHAPKNLQCQSERDAKL